LAMDIESIHGELGSKFSGAYPFLVEYRRKGTI
jgi:hypothetical protein